MQGRSTAERKARDDVIEALLLASRAMVALAGRTLAEVDAEVTLPQSRALIVVASRGPQRVTDIAADLGVAPSTATRMCDRLVRKGLVRRYRTASNRREVRLNLTPAGRSLVSELAQRRRDELARYADAIPTGAYPQLATALHAFSNAVGEIPERDWSFASAGDGDGDGVDGPEIVEGAETA
jgi:DNA-binding MarR family transcriptional regulator